MIALEEMIFMGREEGRRFGIRDGIRRYQPSGFPGKAISTISRCGRAGGFDVEEGLFCEFGESWAEFGVLR
jgi:hypothetical protein